MGYTHCWNEKHVGKERWRKFKGAVQEMIDRHNQELPIDWEYDEADKPPQVDDNCVRFNGRGDDGHETFMIERLGRGQFEFCKTARKPYDVYVVACLILLHHYKPQFTWRSDGDTAEEFQVSYLWAKEVEPNVSSLGLVECRHDVAEIESTLEGEYTQYFEALPSPSDSLEKADHTRVKVLTHL